MLSTLRAPLRPRTPRTAPWPSPLRATPPPPPPSRPRGRRGFLTGNDAATRTEVLESLGEMLAAPSGPEIIGKHLDDAAMGALKAAMRKAAATPAGTGSGGGAGVGVAVEGVTWLQLRLVALESGLVFVGFGTVDNAAMLFFGDQIDKTLGVALGISTLASAGLGNTISDILGIGLGGAVARFANSLGLPTATLTLQQTTLRSVRWARQFGATFGVVVGCLLGMTPLLFMDQHQTEKRKRRQRVEDLMDAAVEHISEVVDGESATLFVVDHGELWTRASKELGKGDVRMPMTTGLAGKCATSGASLIVNDPYAHPDFNPAVDKERGSRTRSVICCPVFDASGTHVVGVIEVVNKRAASPLAGAASSTSNDGGAAASDAEVGNVSGSAAGWWKRLSPFRKSPGGSSSSAASTRSSSYKGAGGASEAGFTPDDERRLAAISPHIAMALHAVDSDEDEVDETKRFVESLMAATRHHLRFESERAAKN